MFVLISCQDLQFLLVVFIGTFDLDDRQAVDFIFDQALSGDDSLSSGWA